MSPRIKKMISKRKKCLEKNPKPPLTITTPSDSPTSQHFTAQRSSLVTPNNISPQNSTPTSSPLPPTLTTTSSPIPPSTSPAPSPLPPTATPTSSPLPPTSSPAPSPLPPNTAQPNNHQPMNTPSQVPQTFPYPSIPHPPYVGPSTWYPPPACPPQYYFPGYYPYPPGVGPSSPSPPCSQPTKGSSQSSTENEDNRPIIQLEGETFYPHLGPTHRITEIIRGRFDGAYMSWKKVPAATRDLWLKKFERSFKWIPEHHTLIRTNFEKHGSLRLRDMLSVARRSGDRPDWIGEEIWTDLTAFWESTEYMHKSEQNKKNRASDCEGFGRALHTGGSIPTTEHKRRLEKTLSRPPTLSELHTRVHQRRSDSSWVDLKSASVHDKYTQLKATTSCQSSVEGSSSEQSEFEMWTQAAGGFKKGRLYGVGSHARTLQMPSTYSMGASIDAHIQRIVEDKTASIEKRMQAMEAEHQRMMRDMYYSGSPHPPPPPPPTEGDVNNEEEHNEEGDDVEV